MELSPSYRRTILLLLLWMAQNCALYHVSTFKEQRSGHISRFLSEVQTFLVSQFYYGQNIDALLVTFDRFAAVYGMLKNMKVLFELFIFNF